ncbi:glycosyltransferase family 1 protein [Parathielavia hyrcaniae]|uniref:UDP-N-acetylglucosamine transferase subunit ALG14 n=1 Tax=Parathielavia hyrcaniae TaxID=113614 RepID=A0AAN6Q6M1_9PEZI|nr:glycosyltransferase family 1 protein [Parathielavia hyrcaniae]
MDQIVREMVEDFGPDRFAFFVYLGLTGIIIVSIVGFFLLSWSWITAIVLVFITFLVWRHLSLYSEHPRPQTGRRWITRRDPSTPNTAGLPAVYFLYILGSGGHTTEMLETIRRKFAPQTNLHRRYLVTTGDTDSLHRVAQLEALIRRCFPDARAGTMDAFRVPRARRVHQPLWTAPLTCLGTAIAAVNALTREPDARPSTRHGGQFKYPHVVLTNGPATGFIVCLVAHLLKLLYVVPPSRLKMVYVESWARSRRLSLTGRLFWWSGIADLFCVQHEELASRLGARAVFVGSVAERLAPPG